MTFAAGLAFLVLVVTVVLGVYVLHTAIGDVRQKLTGLSELRSAVLLLAERPGGAEKAPGEEDRRAPEPGPQPARRLVSPTTARLRLQRELAAKARETETLRRAAAEVAAQAAAERA